MSAGSRTKGQQNEKNQSLLWLLYKGKKTVSVVVQVSGGLTFGNSSEVSDTSITSDVLKSNMAQDFFPI